MIAGLAPQAPGLLGTLLGAALGGFTSGLTGRLGRGGGGGGNTSTTSHVYDDGNPLPGGATGGFVIGPGTGISDSIRARVSAGEYLLKAEAVRGVGLDALDYINRRGELPRMDYSRHYDLRGGDSQKTTIHNDNRVTVNLQTADPYPQVSRSSSYRQPTGRREQIDRAVKALRQAGFSL